MGDPTDQRSLLTAARAEFLGSGSPELRGVPHHVAASWRRSASRGVRPDEVTSEYCTELDLGSRLARRARPVVDQLVEQLADVPVCVALTDHRARILSRAGSSSRLGRVLDRVSFAQGYGYAEGAVGTNGVGTVLESGRSVHIVGAEHFVETLQPFACAGAPIRDPLSGRIEGVLDLSCLREHSTPILHSLVRSAARRIERDLVRDRDPLQQALFDAYSRADARTRQAVLAVGRRVVVANAPMRTLLDPADQEVLHDHVRFLLLGRSTVDDRVDLPSGARVRVRGSAVTVGDDVAGLVGVVTPLPEVGDPGGPVVPAPRRPVAAAPDPPARVPASRSPGWRAAAAAVEAALRAGDPVLVLGEAGTGRLTLLTELHRLVHGTGRAVVLAADEVEAAPDEAAARLLRAEPGPVLRVLRDVDRLSDTAVAALAAALGPAGAPRSLAATAAAPGGADAGHRALLAVFRVSATVPPLRHRGADLPALAARVLADLAPHRDVRLSPDAVRLLVRHRWPGNVGQLADALAAALDRRPVGTIEAGDLPASCQSAPRSSLRPVEEIERDAIVAALRDAGGNRVAAAGALGLARSTLYRKIRRYGITA